MSSGILKVASFNLIFLWNSFKAHHATIRKVFARARARVCARWGGGEGVYSFLFVKIPLCITPAVFNAQEEKSFSGK